MSHRFGISCPECDSASRVIDTQREADRISRVRQCRGGGHLFHTDETPHRCTPPSSWPVASRVLDSRNQADRVLRERAATDGTRFRTIERIRRHG